MPNLKDATTPPNLEGWVQVNQTANKIPPPPAADQSSQPGFDSLSLAPAPSVLSTDADRQRQFYRRGVSQFRMAPLPTKANPSINASARSVATQVVVEAIAAIPPAPPAGGSIDGTTSSPFIPYTVSPDTLADSTWEFDTSNNVLRNRQAGSTIDMVGSGGNEIELGMNTGGSFPTYLSMDDSDGGSVFLALRPSTHEAEFSLSDSAGDGFSFNAENGFGINCQWIAASLFDNIIIDCTTNSELFQMESGLGGLIIWTLDTDGSSDWEQVDAGGSFAEIYQDGSGTTSYFQMEDAAAANVFQVDIGKGGVAGTVAVTLKSPAPSIKFDIGAGGAPTITVSNTTPTGTPTVGSLHINTSGNHGALTLLYIFSAGSWVGIA